MKEKKEQFSSEAYRIARELAETNVRPWIVPDNILLNRNIGMHCVETLSKEQKSCLFDLIFLFAECGYDFDNFCDDDASEILEVYKSDPVFRFAFSMFRKGLERDSLRMILDKLHGKYNSAKKPDNPNYGDVANKTFEDWLSDQLRDRLRD